MFKLLGNVIISVITIVLFIYALVGIASGQSRNFFEDSHPKSEETKEQPSIKIKIRDTASNAFDHDNGIPLIESTNNYLETTIHYRRVKDAKVGKNLYWGSTGIGMGAKHMEPFGKFTVGVMRPFNKVDFSIQGTAFLSQRYKFGDVRAEISRTYRFSKENRTKVRPFMNFSYITPLQTERSNVNTGFVFRSGLQYLTEVQDVEFDFKGQMFLDSGAILKGIRTGTNCEAEILFPFPKMKGRLKFGPKYAFTYFPSLDSHTHELKRSFSNIGFTVALF